MRYFILLLAASFAATPAMAQDADRSVDEGGVKVDGWKSRIDRRPTSQGMTVADSKFAAEGHDFRLSIGPAGNYWSDDNVASGDYQVSATFQEHAMNSGHPHPYGIFIGGADLESDTEMLLYCIAYGNGTYSVKTFHGANVTTLVNKAPHDAIHKAADDGAVTNKVGWTVSGGTASCLINDTEVSSFEQSEVVGADKVMSTDGIYGIRVSHNLELTVSGFGLSHN